MTSPHLPVDQRILGDSGKHRRPLEAGAQGVGTGVAESRSEFSRKIPAFDARGGGGVAPPSRNRRIRRPARPRPLPVRRLWSAPRRALRPAARCRRSGPPRHSIIRRRVCVVRPSLGQASTFGGRKAARSGEFRVNGGARQRGWQFFGEIRRELPKIRRACGKLLRAGAFCVTSFGQVFSERFSEGVRGMLFGRPERVHEILHP